MKVEEIEQEAMALNEIERACLAVKLLGTLPVATVLTDAELEQREKDMASGSVATISQTEFNRRVQLERGR